VRELTENDEGEGRKIELSTMRGRGETKHNARIYI
jgi:hypothetical protein